jgi:hypothetical protein
MYLRLANETHWDCWTLMHPVTPSSRGGTKSAILQEGTSTYVFHPLPGHDLLPLKLREGLCVDVANGVVQPTGMAYANSLLSAPTKQAIHTKAVYPDLRLAIPPSQPHSEAAPIYR